MSKTLHKCIIYTVLYQRERSERVRHVGGGPGRRRRARCPNRTGLIIIWYFDIYIKIFLFFSCNSIWQNIHITTFFVDSPLEIFDELENTVKIKYGIDEYLIAFEPCNDKGEQKPHYHFIVYTTLKNCINLIQKLVKRLQLKHQRSKRRP